MAFHFYDISEVYSNADGSVQYIELTTTVSGQHVLGTHTIVGTRSFGFSTNLPSSATANTSVLIATQGFADLGLVTPDYIIPNNQTMTPFLLVNNGSVNFAEGTDIVSWTALPGGTLSINRSGTSVTNSPKNFAGVSAVIPGNPVAGNASDNNLNGTTAADFMVANAGNDTLSGGAGADTMRGGLGDDVFVADSSDVLVENSAEGTDTVQSSGAWTLEANFEHLLLTGAENVAGSGNAVANSITGNSGNNALAGNDGDDTLTGGDGNDTLTGGEGIDTLQGGSGSDTYVVTSGDTLVELGGGGSDTVLSAITWTLRANLEKLTLTDAGNVRGTGNGLANTLTGNIGNNLLSGLGGADRLIGGAGNDTLKGGAGKDTLSGGEGADKFLFDAALSATTNVDRISDFSHLSDKIRLDDDIFTALSAPTSTALKAAQFHSGAGVMTAHDATDRILYDTSTGNLYYDADGDGSGSVAVQFATLTGAPVVTAADFTIVA